MGYLKLDDIILLIGFMNMFALPPCAIQWYIYREKVIWNKYDYLLLVVPPLIHMHFLFIVDDMGFRKSLGNMNVELITLGLAVALSPQIRFRLIKKNIISIGARGIFVAYIILTLLILFLVPEIHVEC